MVEQWCNTSRNVSKTSFVWKLSNFSLLFGNVRTQVIIESSEFFSNEDTDLKCRLKLRTRGKIKCAGQELWSKIHLSAAFSSDQGEKEIVGVHGSLLFTKVNNEKILEKKVEIPKFSTPLLSKFLIEIEPQVFYIITANCPIKCRLPDDVLKIQFQFEILMDVVHKSGHNFQISKPEIQLLKGFANIFESSVLADVTFVISDQEIKAHKVILAARSAVFLSMFQHDMREKKENRVEVSGIEAKTFQEMLRFIYTGVLPVEVEGDYKVVVDLLLAADKYDVSDLKGTCEYILSNSITVENAAEILYFSFKLPGLKILKKVAIDFMKDNDKIN